MIKLQISSETNTNNILFNNNFSFEWILTGFVSFKNSVSQINEEIKDGIIVDYYVVYYDIYNMQLYSNAAISAAVSRLKSYSNINAIFFDSLQIKKYDLNQIENISIDKTDFSDFYVINIEFKQNIQVFRNNSFTGLWILETGFWNDNGIWDDTAVWND